MDVKKLNIDNDNVKDNVVDAGHKLIGKQIKKGISSVTGSGITLTNNKIKDIIEVIRSLKKREVLIKETTTKRAS